MRGEHKINYNQGAQTIRASFTNEIGIAVRPSAATFELVDERFTDSDPAYVVAAVAAATIDPVSTVTTADCGRGSADPSLVTLSSVASIVATREYLLSNAIGQSEPVTVTAINATAKTVRLAVAPRHTYLTGATFAGLEVTATIPADVANDELFYSWKLAVIWTLTGVEPARVRDDIRIVRPLPSWATMRDVLELEPGLTGHSGDLERALSMAHADLETDLRCAGVDPHTYNTGAIGRDYVRHKAAYHALKDHSNPATQERAKDYQRRAGWLSNNLTNGRSKPGTSETSPATGARVAVDVRSLFSGL